MNKKQVPIFKLERGQLEMILESSSSEKDVADSGLQSAERPSISSTILKINEPTLYINFIITLLSNFKFFQIIIINLKFIHEWRKEDK